MPAFILNNRMSTLLMIHSTQKGFEVSQCLGPIQIRPCEAVLWPVNVRSEKCPKNHFELQSQKVIFYRQLNKNN